MKDDYIILYHQFSLPHVYISLSKVWENVLFALGNDKVK